jgi:hypothetical protein
MYREYMLNEVENGDDFDGVFAMIKEKMPWTKGEEVRVQQDGAPPHTGKGNMDVFLTAGWEPEVERGWNIAVVTQPAQSPDLNINDLGFFRSLKSRVEPLQGDNRTKETLMNAIEQAWEEYDHDTLERVWAHQLACYRCILEDEGGNWYEAPHSGVRRRQNAAQEACDYSVSRQLFDKAVAIHEGYFNDI